MVGRVVNRSGTTSLCRPAAAAVCCAMADDDFFGEQPLDDKGERDREWHALRRKHVKDGYREGSERGHDAQMQAGFDDGFLAGAQATADAGYWLGVSAVLDAFYSRRPKDGVASSDIEALRQARSELEKAANELGTEGDQPVLNTTATKAACDKILKVRDGEEQEDKNEGDSNVGQDKKNDNDKNPALPVN